VGQAAPDVDVKSGLEFRRKLMAGTSTPTPSISVLIGVYNAVAYLGEAIDSVLAQTCPPLEVIVVDDGSDDGTDEVAAAYGDAIVYVSQENRGEGGARNTAVRHARGDLLAFMDGDDRSVPHRLASQLAAMQSDPRLDAVFGRVREFVSPELSEHDAAPLGEPRPDAPFVSVSLMMVRRAAFERVGPFSEDLHIGANLDWCARALDLGLRTVTLDDVLIERRLHMTNLGRRRRDARHQYVDIVRASLERRRAAATTDTSRTE
jgi:glycosyltransferase involved in cell wall biosynthesis